SALLNAGAAGIASAATFTYTPSNSATDLWSAGTNWDATPVSASTTRLTFVARNATVFSDGLVNINTDDIAGQFQLNLLDLQGTGPNSGAATISINSMAPATGLSFVSNGTTTPTISLNAVVGVAGLTYNLNAPLTLVNNTTIQGSGTATFNFGGITTTSTLTKTGTSAMTLTGPSSIGSLAVVNLSAVALGSPAS